MRKQRQAREDLGTNEFENTLVFALLVSTLASFFADHVDAGLLYSPDVRA